MKHNLKPKEKSQRCVKLTQVPAYITCPKCGGEIELWTYEESLTVCLFCGHQVFKKENILH